MYVYFVKDLIMMKRTTDLMNELSHTSHIDQYLNDNKAYIIDQTLSKYLCDIIEEKSLSKADIIKKDDDKPKTVHH